LARRHRPLTLRDTLAAIQRLAKDFAFVLNQTPPRSYRVRDTAEGLSVIGAIADWARRLSYGALHKGPADAGAGRDLGDRPVTASSSPSECSAGALDRACGYRQFSQHAAMQPRTLAKVPPRIREEGAAL